MGAEQRSNPYAAWKNNEGVSRSKAYDRNGRELRVGDTAHLIGKGDIMWRVTKVTPILAPGAPPGLVEIQMHALFITGVAGGQPIADLLKTKDASELPAVHAATPGEEPPADEKGTVQ